MDRRTEPCAQAGRSAGHRAGPQCLSGEPFRAGGHGLSVRAGHARCTLDLLRGIRETCLAARRNVSLRMRRGLKRGSVQRARMESRRCPADLEQVAQDLAYLSGVGDDRDEPHLGPTPGTEQRALAVRFAATLSARKRACRARAAARGSDRQRATPSRARWRQPAGTSAPGGTAAIPGEQRVRGGASAATVPCTVKSTTRSSGCSELPMGGTLAGCRPGYELCKRGDEIGGAPQAGVLNTAVEGNTASMLCGSDFGSLSANTPSI